MNNHGPRIVLKAKKKKGKEKTPNYFFWRKMTSSFAF